MKTAIVFADGLKQIILTPENDDEKKALKLITPQDDIELAVHTASFGEARFKPFTVKINESKGGYLRTYDDTESIMLVLRPRAKAVKQEEPRDFGHLV